MKLFLDEHSSEVIYWNVEAPEEFGSGQFYTMVELSLFDNREHFNIDLSFYDEETKQQKLAKLQRMINVLTELRTEMEQ